MMVFAGIVTLAIPVCTFLYAKYGTAVPFLVNSRGPAKAPASDDERMVAATLCVMFTAMLVYVIWYALSRGLARPTLAFDAEGVWFGHRTRGQQVRDGLRWDQIAGVHVVPVGGRTTVPPNRAVPPLVEVFPVRPVESGKLLSFRVVNAPPPVPGVRGKRYVFGLAADTDTATLTAAVDRYALGRRVDTQTSQ
nr:hypothetical protein [Kibdelosporangium sp. MJ126-NF4]CTQ91381.1 hypothetical protein [Kibdelosporangium sp. MJ126-NF4]